MDRIYTRTGDGGETSLLGGGRVEKSHPRVDAYGTVDELNAVLGVAILRVKDEGSRERLERIQHDLFALGAALAVPVPEAGRPKPKRPPLPRERVGEMEGWIDEISGELEPLRSFILPGGSDGAAALHLARTVCRRAERAVVALGDEEVEEGAVEYLNRLSDLMFVLARLENSRAGREDVTWEQGR